MGLRIVSNVVKTIKFKLILFGTFFSWKQIKINDLVVVVVRVVWFEVVEEITVFFSNLARVFYAQFLAAAVLPNKYSWRKHKYLLSYVKVKESVKSELFSA